MDQIILCVVVRWGGGRKCPTKKVVLVLEPETCVEVTEEVERH